MCMTLQMWFVGLRVEDSLLERTQTSDTNTAGEDAEVLRTLRCPCLFLMWFYRHRSNSIFGFISFIHSKG